MRIKTTLLVIFLMNLPSIFFAEDINSHINLCFLAHNSHYLHGKKHKTTFDVYLNTRGIFRARPFANFRDLEKYISTNRNSAVIISELDFYALDTYNDFKSILHGIVDGKISEPLVIVTRKDFKASDHKVIKIGSSVSKEICQPIIDRMVIDHKEPNKKHNTNIVAVPKDYDALMSLSFNIFDLNMAITRMSSYNRYCNTEVKFKDDLIKTDTSFMVGSMIVVIHKKFLHKKEELKSLLTNLSNSLEGKELLNLLGVDKFESCKKTIEPVKNLGDSK